MSNALVSLAQTDQAAAPTAVNVQAKSRANADFVAHLIANLSDPPVSKGTTIGTENLTFRFHIENGKNGKELKGTLEGVFLDMEGNTLAQLPGGFTWEAVPLTITSNGYN